MITIRGSSDHRNSGGIAHIGWNWLQFLGWIVQSFDTYWFANPLARSTIMKTLALLLCLALVANTECGVLNVDSSYVLELLEDPRLVEYYTACIAGQGTCDARGKELRRYIPEIFSRRRCIGCTTRENYNLRLLVASVQKMYPKCWRVVLAATRNLPAIPPFGCST